MAPVLLLPAGEWLAWRDSLVHHIGLFISFGVTFVIMGALIGLPMSLTGLFFPRRRRNSLWLLLCSLTAIPCFMSGLTLSQAIKQRPLEQVMLRAEPLIAAIRKFEAQHGRPPPSLDKLTPDYLTTIPTPGIGTAPTFHYLLTGERSEMADNAWMLEVRPPVAGIGFDVFIYMPNQNYPKRGWGGVLERMGTWAYVHE